VIKDHSGIICLGTSGESGTGTGILEEQQIPAARKESCTLAVNLMEKICNVANLNQAYKRVKSNKGSAGVDGLTVQQLGAHIREHKEQLIKELMNGSYKPQPVKRVMIPKAGGGERQLGIPTVVDRLVQQAIHQILEPIFDANFSDSSYGFRPNRGAHGALKKAKAYVEDGHGWVVDIDLEKFFDRVNHDILMSKLAKRIEDKRLLRIIRRFLQAGVMEDGVITERYEGTPQGGPLSPLLSNILLDELDQELERRGHKFCRYADDQNIYVRSRQAGERVYASIKRFLEKRLRLKVNEEKSAVAEVRERKFLGYRILSDGRLTVSPQSIQRAKDKIREITKRNRGRSIEGVIPELNEFLRGWLGYYRLAETKGLWEKLDSWIRRRLRCFRLKQKKGSSTIGKWLRSLGIPERDAQHISSSGKGWWRLSGTHAVQIALNNGWFKTQGLISLKDRWATLLNT
jgi:RNA-directed DNA polymerase